MLMGELSTSIHPPYASQCLSVPLRVSDGDKDSRSICLWKEVNQELSADLDNYLSFLFHQIQLHVVDWKQSQLGIGCIHSNQVSGKATYMITLSDITVHVSRSVFHTEILLIRRRLGDG